MEDQIKKRRKKRRVKHSKGARAKTLTKQTNLPNEITSAYTQTSESIPKEVRRGRSGYRPFKHALSKEEKEASLKEANNICKYCELSFGTIVYLNDKQIILKACFDHFKPYSKFRDNSKELIIPCCQICNLIKSDKVFASIKDVQDHVKLRFISKGYTLMQDLTGKIVIFDLDGTLTDPTHRLHLLDKDHKLEAKDCLAFYAASKDDLPKPAIIRMTQILHAAGYVICIFTGRGEEVEAETREWLAKYDVRYTNLLMRPAGCIKVDVDLKSAWLSIWGKENVFCVFEDRDSMVKF